MLRPLDDRETREFMERFFINISPEEFRVLMNEAMVTPTFPADDDDPGAAENGRLHV